MQVTSGSEWQQGSGRRSYGVSLNDDDGVQVVPGWDEMGWTAKYKALQKAADKMVVLYMYQNEALGKEMYNARMAEINKT